MAPPSPHPTDQTLSSYGLGKLDEVSAEGVNKHLEGCPDCRKLVAEMSSDSFLGRVRDAQDEGKQTFDRYPSGETTSQMGTNDPMPFLDSMLPPGLSGLPDYQILRELGRGGMGVVYLAHNSLMGRDEVLKVMGRQIIERPGVLDRFLREIRAVARLRHPNIVTAYSAVRLGESIVFAMEYVEGLDLFRLVKAKGPLPVVHACFFAHQAALGLQHAHEEGLVHRDIKPANLMLSRKGVKATVKVLDFGLAKVAREEKIDGGLTSVGQALGTPDFMAPEQILDAQSADVRADIYSLGATLYLLLTGRAPFQGNTLYDIFQAHISRDADPLNLIRPEVPSELAALVAKMMAKDPARRFQTPGEVAEALKPFFKRENAASRSPADVSLPDSATAGRPAAGAVSSPTQPATDAGGPDVLARRVAKPTVLGARSDSPIDFKEAESSIEQARRPAWVWPSVAIGVLMLGFFAAWLGGVFKLKTSEGVIVLGNVPMDSEILVDGDKISFTWPGGGKPVEIRPLLGRRKIEVKKDGFTTFVKELIVKTDKEEITVRLEPIDPTRLGKNDAADGLPTRAVDGPAQPLVGKPKMPPALVKLARGDTLVVGWNGEKNDWSRLDETDPIKDGTRILGFAPFWTTLQTNSVQVILVGDAETSITLGDRKAAIKLGFDHGRVILKGGADGLPYHITFAGKVLGITNAPGVSLGLSRTWTTIPGIARAASAPLVVYVPEGEIVFEVGATKLTVKGPGSASLTDGGEFKTTKGGVIPAWLGVPGPTPSEKGLGERFLKYFRPSGTVLRNLVQAVDADDPDVRRVAIQALGAVGDVEMIVPILNDAMTDPATRRVAANVLRSMLAKGGEPAKAVRTELRKVFGEELEDDSEKLLIGFTPEEGKREQTYTELVKLLSTPEVGTRELALQALMSLTGRDNLEYDPVKPEGRGLKAWHDLLYKKELHKAAPSPPPVPPR
jgi:serine/threonine protein kinase